MAASVRDRYIRHKAYIIAPPLTIILIRSLQTGAVPADWRKVRLRPHFKRETTTLQLGELQAKEL